MAFWQGCRSFLFDPIFFAFPELALNTEHSLSEQVSLGFVLADFANSQGCSGQGSFIRLRFSVRCAADEWIWWGQEVPGPGTFTRSRIGNLASSLVRTRISRRDATTHRNLKDDKAR